MESARAFVLADIGSGWIDGIKPERIRIDVEGWTQRFAEIEALPSKGVLLCSADPLEFCTAFFAAVCAEIPVILANPDWTEGEWAMVFGQLDPGYVIGQCSASVEAERQIQALPKGAILIPTGGSTGGIKFTIHSRASLNSGAAGLQAFLGGGPIDSLCALPLFHVSGLMQVIRSFLSGGRIRFVDRHSLSSHLTKTETLNRLCLSVVPTQLHRLMSQPDSLRGLKKLRAIFLGGAALPRGLRKQILLERLPILYGYGMTETAAMIAVIPEEDFLQDQEVGAVALPHATLDIVDESGRVCEPGVRGRIRICSRALFSGYWGMETPDLSGGYLTGDCGFVDANGRLEVVGRLDNLINTGGEKVDPAEVESALLTLPGISQALVVGFPDAEWGECVAAFIVTDRSVVSTHLREDLKRQLAAYKIPKCFSVVSKLPLNERGKPDWLLIKSILQKSCPKENETQPPQP